MQIAFPARVTQKTLQAQFDAVFRGQSLVAFPDRHGKDTNPTLTKIWDQMVQDPAKTYETMIPKWRRAPKF